MPLINCFSPCTFGTVQNSDKIKTPEVRYERGLLLRGEKVHFLKPRVNRLGIWVSVDQRTMLVTLLQKIMLKNRSSLKK